MHSSVEIQPRQGVSQPSVGVGLHTPLWRSCIAALGSQNFGVMHVWKWGALESRWDAMVGKVSSLRQKVPAVLLSPDTKLTVVSKIPNSSSRVLESEIAAVVGLCPTGPNSHLYACSS